MVRHWTRIGSVVAFALNLHNTVNVIFNDFIMNSIVFYNDLASRQYIHHLFYNG